MHNAERTPRLSPTGVVAVSVFNEAQGKEGAAPLVITKGYKSTMAISTMQHMLAAQHLRQPDVEHSLPESRRKARLLLAGRTKLERVGVKHCVRDRDYDPGSDTCIEAFGRLLGVPPARPKTTPDPTATGSSLCHRPHARRCGVGLLPG